MNQIKTNQPRSCADPFQQRLFKVDLLRTQQLLAPAQTCANWQRPYGARVRTSRIRAPQRRILRPRSATARQPHVERVHACVRVHTWDKGGKNLHAERWRDIQPRHAAGACVYARARVCLCMCCLHAVALSARMRACVRACVLFRWMNRYGFRLERRSSGKLTSAPNARRRLAKRRTSFVVRCNSVRSLVLHYSSSELASVTSCGA